MANDTFYFSHDYSARNDEKIKRLIKSHGMAGYGLFWAIIEDLYHNNNSLGLDYPFLAYEYRVSEDVIKSIINDFSLFTNDDKTFGSTSISKRIDLRKEKSKTASDNAFKRWGTDIKRTQAKEHIFYLLKMYNDTECFLKCGVTSESISRRYSGKTPYKYDVIICCETNCENALEYERKFCETFANYLPKLKFAGYLECLEVNEIDKIYDFAMQDVQLRNAIKERKGKENKVKDIKIKDIKLENIYIPENEFSVNEKFDNLFYSQITKIWFDFYLDNFSLKPSFGAMEGKKLKSIANKIKNISIQMNLDLNQDLMEKSFLKFLNLAFSDNWLKSNFQLSILDSKFDSIIQKENYGKSATTKIVKSSFGD
jgi:hypothetical protein